MSNTRVAICKDCRNKFEAPIQRGRPPVRCSNCKANLEGTGETAVVVESPQTINAPIDSAPETLPPKPNGKYNPEVPYLFRVMVGNFGVNGGLGIAFAAEQEKDARDNYKHYCKASQQGFGQVGFEPVQLWKLNNETTYEVVESFVPERNS